MNYVYYPDELYHFGVKGQKWGERRWQNPDGSLTPEGRIHYGYDQQQAYVNRKDLRNVSKSYRKGKATIEELGEAHKKVNKDNWEYAKSRGIARNAINVLTNHVYAPAFTSYRASGKSVAGSYLSVLRDSAVYTLSGTAIGAGVGYLVGGGRNENMLFNVAKGMSIGGTIGTASGALRSYSKANKRVPSGYKK